MTSHRKLAANKQNASKSTGPRTQVGKLRSSRNSLKHGLSIPVSANAGYSQQVLDLAETIVAASNLDDASSGNAWQVAEAEIELLRVRSVRAALLARVTKSGKAEPGDDAGRPTEQSELWRQLTGLDRYERRALSRRNTALEILDAHRVAAPHR